jgi:hypothetical protein
MLSIHIHLKELMRLIPLLCSIALFAACNPRLVNRNESHTVGASQEVAARAGDVSVDSIAQLLVGYAATDFRTTGQPPTLRFRNVRIGHITGTNGELRYILCGEFTSNENGNEMQWTPFATIKTDPYEQWLGGHATTFCQESTLDESNTADLTSRLQSEFDSLQ